MITINIPRGVDKVSTSPVYQWDYGQVLRITGDDLPTISQVHFCNADCDKAIVRVASTVNAGLEVTIPDKMFQSELAINAFIYLNEEKCGKTIKHIQIPVYARTQPEDYVDPLPEDVQTQLEEMIANVNTMVRQAEEFYSQGLTSEELVEIIKQESAVAQKIQRDIVQPPVNGKEATNNYSVEIDEEGNPIHKVVDNQGVEPITRTKTLATQDDVNAIKHTNTVVTGTGSVTISKAGIYLVKSNLGDMILHIPSITANANSNRVVTNVSFLNETCFSAYAQFTASTKKVTLVEDFAGVDTTLYDISVITICNYE